MSKPILPPENQSTAGKTLLKKVVITYFKNKKKIILKDSDIRITKEATGRPVISIKNHLDINKTISVSISHAKQFVAADITDAGHIGIDVETIRKLPKIVSDKFLTQNEKKWIASKPPSQKNTYIILFWSFKEAYLKAIGTGLRTHPQKVEIIENKKKNFDIWFLGSKIKSKRWYTIDIINGFVTTKVIIPR